MPGGGAAARSTSRRARSTPSTVKRSNGGARTCATGTRFGDGYSRLPSDTSHASNYITYSGGSNRYGTNFRSRCNLHITLTSHNRAATSGRGTWAGRFQRHVARLSSLPRRLHSSSHARRDAPSEYGPDDTRGAHRHPQTSAQRPRTGAQHARKTCTNCGLRRPTDEARRRWRGLRRRS